LNADRRRREVYEAGEAVYRVELNKRLREQSRRARRMTT
jgi:hypothetical protein